MRRLIWLAASAALIAGCGGGGGDQAANASGQPQAARAGGGADLTGAGSTFIYPAFQKWFYEYAQNTGVKINYQPIGSGGGIRQLSEGTVDFAGSDAPMSDEEIAKAQGPVLQLPMVIGAVAITYNLPDLSQPIRLSGDVLADVFLGKITRWNDARIAALNPGVSLPAQDLLVVHRSDGSGTTYIFTDYLSAVSPGWKSGPGMGKEVAWPVGLGGKGNEGVSGQIKQTPGSIGYVELAYANQNKLPVAQMKNAAGNFLAPTIQGTTAAAAAAAAALGSDTDFRVSIVNASGADAYPIASFSWLILYTNQKDAGKGRKLVDFITWALTDGQKDLAALDYAPLPDNVVQLEQQELQQKVTGVAAQ